MDNFEKENEEQNERLMYEKTVTVLFFSIYMASTLISSILINTGKSPAYVFGIMLGTTIAMILFVPNITGLDIALLMSNILYFTVYPLVSHSYIMRILIISDYIACSLKFTMFITQTYLSEKKESF